MFQFLIVVRLYVDMSQSFSVSMFLFLFALLLSFYEFVIP